MNQIFVVDDDESYRELVLLTLEDQCDVSSVNGFDGADALLRHLAVPQAVAPELLLLDLHMKGRDGLALLRELRARGVQVPVVFLSGAAGAEERATCLAEGASAFLMKPVAYSDLVRSLQQLVRTMQAGLNGAGAGAGPGPAPA